MGFILFLISLILVIALTPFGVLFTIIKSALFGNKKYINKYWIRLAVSLDQFGGVVMGGFFNLVLIKSKTDTFGDPDETISSVLGKNQKAGTLRYLGRRLVALLDWLEEDHSLNAIEN